MSVHIDRLLETVVKRKASDLYLVVGRPPTIRIDERLRTLETKSLEQDDVVSLMKSVTPDRNRKQFEEANWTEFGFAFGEEARFRVSLYRQKGNLSIALRHLPLSPPSLDDIGLPKICKALCRRPRGLFLVMGPAGCGKTSTLSSMLDYINENFDRNIVTIEQPIEFYHSHKKSIVSQQDVDLDTPSYSVALSQVRSLKPDVVLLSNLPDCEVIESALDLASDCLVLAEINKRGVSSSLADLVGSFPDPSMESIRHKLGSRLIGAVYQELCPKLDGGLIPAIEFLVVTAAVQSLIVENKMYRINSGIATGKKFGMQLLDDHLYQLCQSGIIANEVAIDKARNPGEMQDKLERGREDDCQEGPVPVKPKGPPPELGASRDATE